jgi:hypothetical protein
MVAARDKSLIAGAETVTLDDEALRQLDSVDA